MSPSHLTMETSQDPIVITLNKTENDHLAIPLQMALETFDIACSRL